MYIRVCVHEYPTQFAPVLIPTHTLRTLPYTATSCNKMKHPLQHTLQHTATHCNTLQHTATHCNTLQRTATYCNTPRHYFCCIMRAFISAHELQHTATNCNTQQHMTTHSDTPRLFRVESSLSLLSFMAAEASAKVN